MKCSTLTILLGLTSSAFSSPLQSRQTSIEQITDDYLFKISMADFNTHRSAKDNAAELDWVSDGCTASPENPLGFNFKDSCNRHDFGYRNYRRQNRFTDDAKARIDSNFKKDMYNQCAGNFFRKKVCQGTADVYYEAVRAFGQKRANEI